MLPPNIAGHDPNLDPFNTKSGKPQIDKAKDELKQCGKPDGFTTVIAAPQHRQGAEDRRGAAAGARAGRHQGDHRRRPTPSAYFRSTIGSPNNVHTKGYGIMMAGWGADFPTGYGFLQVLVDGRAIQPVAVTTTTPSSTTRRSTR